MGQNVVLPLWLSAYPLTEVSVDGYFVFSFSSFAFVVIFGVWTLVLAIISSFQSAGKKMISLTEYTFPQFELFKIGFCDALNGIMVIFAASPERTSALLQTILGNFMIPLTVALRYSNAFERPLSFDLTLSLILLIN